jgi:hypothetical protein
MDVILVKAEPPRVGKTSIESKFSDSQLASEGEKEELKQITSVISC